IRGGGTGHDRVLAVSTDGTGNVHVAGSFEGTAIFDSNGTDQQLESSLGSRDAFVDLVRPTGTWFNFETFRVSQRLVPPGFPNDDAFDTTLVALPHLFVHAH